MFFNLQEKEIFHFSFVIFHRQQQQSSFRNIAIVWKADLSGSRGGAQVPI
jgi:hypothetical protein